LVFDYPSIYDNGECGAIFNVEKDIEDHQYDLIGLGSSIRVRVFKKWGSRMDGLIRTNQPPSDIILLTDVERFILGGQPAFRYIHLIPQSPGTFEYAKVAWTMYRNRLYWFSYMDIADLAKCNAPPLSEEDVFEHLVSSLEFLE